MDVCVRWKSGRRHQHSASQRPMKLGADIKTVEVEGGLKFESDIQQNDE